MSVGENINISVGNVYEEDVDGQIGKIIMWTDGNKYQFCKAGAGTSGGIQKFAAVYIDADYLATPVNAQTVLNGISVVDIPEDYYAFVLIKGHGVQVNTDGSIAADGDVCVSIGSGVTAGQVKLYAPATGEVRVTAGGGTGSEVVTVAGLDAADPLVATVHDDEDLGYVVVASGFFIAHDDATGVLSGVDISYITPVNEIAAALANAKKVRDSNISAIAVDAAVVDTITDPITNETFKSTTAGSTKTEVVVADPNNVLSTIFNVGDLLGGCITSPTAITGIAEDTSAKTTTFTVTSSTVLATVNITRTKEEALCRLI